MWGSKTCRSKDLPSTLYPSIPQPSIPLSLNPLALNPLTVNPKRFALNPQPSTLIGVRTCRRTESGVRV